MCTWGSKGESWDTTPPNLMLAAANFPCLKPEETSKLETTPPTPEAPDDSVSSPYRHTSRVIVTLLLCARHAEKKHALSKVFQSVKRSLRRIHAFSKEFRVNSKTHLQALVSAYSFTVLCVQGMMHDYTFVCTQYHSLWCHFFICFVNCRSESGAEAIVMDCRTFRRGTRVRLPT